MYDINLVSNYLRLTSALEIEKANSGHPGVCLGASTIFLAMYNNAFVLPEKPNFASRDRVVFSAGHASALVYATLNLLGFKITKKDLQNFRQVGSITSGHPEVNVTPGIDVSTGPLGQGIANAVGFAIAEKYLNETFKKDNFSPIDHFTYCFTGDGCLMEGVAQEAISIAGNLKLNKLILLYDKNDITIEGPLNIANTENTKDKFLACNWNVLEVNDGNDFEAINQSIIKAKKSNKPTVIIIKTHIGYGSEFEGLNKIHGKPLNKDQITTLRKNLNYFIKDWEIPHDAKDFAQDINNKNLLKEEEYFNKLREYKNKYPNEFKQFIMLENNFKVDLFNLVNSEVSKKFDGRESLNEILNEVANIIPNLIGGCGDVGPSTKAVIKDSKFFNSNNPLGKNIPFGIREHAMGAISNGISLHGGLRAFCSTFFSFANYLTPAIRMSALMNNPVLYLFTHDSFLSGEDGPTHQPAEQIATLRAMPNVYNFRPCGRNELLAGFQNYLNNSRPVSILISRQVTDFVSDNFNEALNGGYVIKDVKNYDASIVATGSEVGLCLKVQEYLAKKNINLRVISLPCVELFESQTESYKKSVIDKTKPVFCVEASSDNIWFKYATNEETLLRFNRFGLSGKPEDLLNQFGFTCENLSNIILKKISK